MIDALIAFAQWLASVIGSAFQFIVDLLLWVPRQVFSLLVDGMVAFFQAIPAPAFVTSTVAAAASLASDVVWWLDLFRADVAVTVFLATWPLRFAIRRLPFFG